MTLNDIYNTISDAIQVALNKIKQDIYPDDYYLVTVGQFEAICDWLDSYNERMV